MKKRFVIGTNGTTAEEDQAFKEKLNVNYPYLAWWHRLGEMWLISDNQGKLNATTLRTMARECFPTKRLLVLEFQEGGTDTWAGLGDVGGNNAPALYAWLHSHWN